MRTLLAIFFLAATLSGCRDANTATVRYRMIATIEIDGKVKEFSTTMNIQYANKLDPNTSIITNTLLGINSHTTHTRSFGEALIVDLGNRGTMYVLPYIYGTGTLSSFHAGAVLRSLGITNKLHAITDADCERIHNIRGRFPFQIGWPGNPELRPAVVTFGDERDSQSVRQIDPFDLDATFGPGVKWRGLEIEITNGPVTSKLPERLPWLVDRNRNKSGDSSLLINPLVAGAGLGRTIQSGHFFHHNGNYILDVGGNWQYLATVQWGCS